MCIAITKQIGCDCPSMDTLKTCWENNSDGAGFAFNLNGRVFIKKGFMKWLDFKNAFEYWDKRVCFKSRGMLIHFRIATHGAKDATMTHPFPITSDDGALGKSEYVSPYAVVHNGIISLTSMASRSTGLSDTATFVKDYLTNISGYKDWFKNGNTMPLIYKLIDSKMAILNGRGEIIRTDGFSEEKKTGIFYSNTTYKENRYKYNYTKSYSSTTSLVENSEGMMIDNNESIKNQYVKLMKIPTSATIITEDGQEYSSISEYGRDGWYMSSDGTIYYGYVDASYDDYSDCDDSWAEYFMEYEAMGKGSVYDSCGKAITFVPTNVIYPEQLID